MTTLGNRSVATPVPAKVAALNGKLFKTAVYAAIGVLPSCPLTVFQPSSF